jgi:hypothetical protein
MLLFTMCTPLLWGQAEMIIVYDGEYAINNNFKAVGMQGDSLALFNYQFQGRQYRISRQKVVPVFGSQAPETVFSYDIDPAWGDISIVGGVPKAWYFQFRNGKLYSAILTESKLIVFFTGTSQTDIHVFDRTGISGIGGYSEYGGGSSFIIRDESIGYFSTFQYNPYLCQYYAMDFSTDTLQMFYSGTGLAIFLLNEDYVLLATAFTVNSGSVLVEGTTVIQDLGTNYLGYNVGMIHMIQPFGSYGNQILMSDGLDFRDDSWTLYAYVQNQNLQFMGGGLGGTGRSFVSREDSTFSCIVYAYDYAGTLICNNFKKFYVDAGQIYPDPSFPNLESYSNPWYLAAMGTDYLLAICYGTGTQLSFNLADYERQQISVRDYNISFTTASQTYCLTNSDYVYIVSGSIVSVLHRDMITAVSDELAPVAPIGITVYPNPFSGVCKIAIDGSKNAPVTVSIYNIKGQLTKTLYQGLNPQGYGALQWDGRTDQNQRAAAGVYWIKVDTGTATATRKIVLMH